MHLILNWAKGNIVCTDKEEQSCWNKNIAILFLIYKDLITIRGVKKWGGNCPPCTLYWRLWTLIVTQEIFAYFFRILNFFRKRLRYYYFLIFPTWSCLSFLEFSQTLELNVNKPNIFEFWYWQDFKFLSWEFGLNLILEMWKWTIGNWLKSWVSCWKRTF